MMMAGVAVVAVNLVLLQTCVSLTNAAPPLLMQHIQGLVPILNVLVVSLCLIFLELRRSGECRPSLLGIQVFGWAAVLLYLGLFTLAPNVIWAYLEAVAGALQSAKLFDPKRSEGPPATVLLNALPFYLVAVWLPQICLAVLGGLVFSKTGIHLARRLPERTR
jgi:hypothetical protein